MTTEKHDKKNSAKISEALELLNEAAKGKKDELKELMTSKYSHIQEAMTAGVDRGQEFLGQAKDFAQDTIAKGEERIKKAANVAEKQVHENPWSYIAGAAAFSLLLGYFMGSKHRHS